jgi:hypothetical protein
MINRPHQPKKGRRRPMKSIFALFMSLILVALATNAYAGEDYYFAKEKEVLYGTWVNMEYQDKPMRFPIIVIKDGGAEYFTSADSNKPRYKTKSLITGRWFDSDGNTMYKSRWVGDWGEIGCTLFRVSNSGNTLEYVLGFDNYPKVVDTNLGIYRKYNRK